MADPDDDPSLTGVPRTRWHEGSSTTDDDTLVREEPLEIRVGGVPIAVVMRSPGHDLELARGFLLTERVVEDATDIVALRHCTTVDEPEAEDNVVQAVLRDDVEVDLARFRRNLYASSSCGICGKATIDAALRHAPPISGDTMEMTAEALYGMPDRLREAQAVFERTGGLHAAGVFDAMGGLTVAREDIGRHNAVDKVVGWAGERGHLPLSQSALMVSGRVSYEIVQKALAARIPLVAAVSAPSSLAVSLAKRAGITLVAFLRGRSASVYSGEQRLVAPPA
ncbi:MAG: formate dehydrogenase accessory sulfurtransferase FdhD [Myxococcota bacterium]